jgi:Family of unknown function (DUF5996)
MESRRTGHTEGLADRVDFTTRPESWPVLALEAWQDTRDTLHMWTQIVGKVRLAQSPLINHWWEVPLYVSARGLTTSTMPYLKGLFEIEFDFLDHNLVIRTSEGTGRTIALAPRPMADFYQEVMATLRSLGIEVKIWSTPCEVPSPIPFEKDVQHSAYDREYATRFWRILTVVDAIFQEFRSGFIGKNSPVHFFWGSFDLAVTRFSGRRAPPREGADSITREAYSHEVISAGFWPGGGDIKGPAFYAYAAPEPAGYGQSVIRPGKAFYHSGMKEFLLMYDDVRSDSSPKAALMEFLQSTYEAGANLARWDRAELDRSI